jgi:hypothetical protein
MRKLKYFSIAASICLMFSLSFFSKVEAQSSDNNWRVFRSGAGWAGCYEPGGSCFSEEPVEEK